MECNTLVNYVRFSVAEFAIMVVSISPTEKEQ